MMKRRRQQVDRVMHLLMYLICIVPFVVIAAGLMLRTFAPHLLAGLFFAGLILMQEPAPPMPPAPEVFRQYVLDPVPASVTNIRADQPREYGGETYTLRFNIDRADLALLVASRSMKRVWNVEYKDGYLDWAWDTWRGHSLGGVSIIVYGPGRRRREPKWFEPQLRNNPEACVFEEKKGDRIKTKVLLYNEREGEAYFIASSWRN